MGAADVVPGVSGGTIAFITGIYEELIHSIKNINFNLLSVWRKQGFWAFYKEANLGFLLPLFIGIALSILSLAKLVTFVLAEYPILTWAFFFGLILASAVYIAKQINKWALVEIVLLVIGTAIAYYISTITPSDGNGSIWYAVLSGAIAICAMILPGISGSLILLLLGMYLPIVTAIADRDFGVILPVAVGAIFGIIAFSHVLSFLFKKYKNQTLAILTGFMLGALNKVWPWKKVLSTYVDSHGDVQPLLEKSVSPTTYQSLLGVDPQLLFASLMAILGFLLVFVIENFAKVGKDD